MHVTLDVKFDYTQPLNFEQTFIFRYFQMRWTSTNFLQVQGLYPRLSFELSNGGCDAKVSFPKYDSKFKTFQKDLKSMPQ